MRSGGIFAILFRCAMLRKLLEGRGLNVDHTTVWRWPAYMVILTIPPDKDYNVVGFVSALSRGSYSN